MRACLIFLVLLASGVYALDNKTTVSSKDVEIPKTVSLTDIKKNSKESLITTASPLEISTIVASNTTTAAPLTTTTPNPTPVPDPKIGKWSINVTDKIIVLRMAAQLDITYNVNDSQTEKKKINIPADNNVTTVTGDFKKNNESITIAWNATNASGLNSVQFHFNKYEQTKTYTLSNVVVLIDASELSGMNETVKLQHSKEHFNTTIGHSYRCVKLQNFNLTTTNDNKKVFGQLKVTDFQFQAFKDDVISNFGLAEDCAFDTSDVVPIAVGCVLAGLVVTVLVAYVISRRNSQARGYLSM